MLLSLVACSDDKASSSSEDDFNIDDFINMVDDMADVETFENVGDGTKVIFEENEEGILTPVGDTVRELDIDCSFELVSFDSETKTFVFKIVNNTDNAIVSVQDGQLYNGTETIVADALVFPDGEAFMNERIAEEPDVDVFELYQEYDELLFDIYNVSPGGSLLYSSTYSRAHDELTEFDVTLTGYYDFEDGSKNYGLTWKCRLE